MLYTCFFLGFLFWLITMVSSGMHFSGTSFFQSPLFLWFIRIMCAAVWSFHSCWWVTLPTLFILMTMDIWVVSRFLLVRIMLLWTFLCMFPGGYVRKTSSRVQVCNPLLQGCKPESSEKYQELFLNIHVAEKPDRTRINVRFWLVPIYFM